jgi:hypothetical protein
MPRRWLSVLGVAALRKPAARQQARCGTLLGKSGPPRVLQNEWGLSLHLESTHGADSRPARCAGPYARPR